jgi:hypothetical protein
VTTGDALQNEFTRPAAIGTLVICIAFVVHNVNGAYVEPRMLGFEDPTQDYAKVAMLRRAIGSAPWLASGFGHFLTGFACVPLALWAFQAFRTAAPVAGALALVAGLFAGAGFLLGGVTDLLGSHSAELLAAANPAYGDEIYLADSLLRVVLNGFAIVSFGWFAAQVSWAARRSGVMGRWQAGFGYLAAASALLFTVVYVPVYLPLYLVWSGWLGLRLRHTA